MRDLFSFSQMLLTGSLACLMTLAVAIPTDAQVRIASKKVALQVPEGTHEQIATIEVGNKSDRTMRINALCMNKDGNLLAACGSGPGEVRVFNKDGKLLDTWKVSIAPEAINVDAEGNVYLAGDGKLLKLNSQGKTILTKDAPHAKNIKGNSKKIREQVIKQMKARAGSYQQVVTMYERMVKNMKDKKEKTKQDEMRIASFEKMIKFYEKRVEDSKGKKLNEKDIERQVAAMSKRKLKVSSLSANEKEIFIACSASTGYGYEVWRTNKNFDDGKVIVKGLRGCCGQMDVQCNDEGVFVAENSRHRVGHYDRDGKLIKNWGKRDRKGVKGFGSCCNPMNVAFGKKGEVYTSESNLGYIKRYSIKGEYLGFVGKVKLVPGCKNVAITVSPNGDRIYMMDLTRNHIVVMARKETSPVTTNKEKS